MKKIFNGSKVQRRIAFYYLLTGMILIGVLSVTTSALLTRQIIRNRHTQADSALKISASAAMLLLEEVYARYFQLFQADEQLLLYKNDTYVYADVQQTIANLAINDFLVDSIVLVDIVNETIIESNSKRTNLNQTLDSGLTELITDIKQPGSAIRNLIFYPRKTTVSSFDREYLTLSFTFGLNQGSIDKVMFVNIDENELSKLLDYQENSSYMVLVNRFGQIIADSSNRYFNTYYYSKETVVDESFGIDVDNAYIADVDGEKSLVTSYQTPKLNLTLFSIYNYRRITSEVNRSNATVILLFGVLLILTAGLSVWLSRKLYSPIQRLVHQVAQINQSHPDFQSDEFEYIYKAIRHLGQRKVSDEIRNILEGRKSDSDHIDWSDTSIVVLQPRFVDRDQAQNTYTTEFLWEIFKPNITVVDDYGLAAIATTSQLEAFKTWKNHGWIAGVSHKVERTDQIRLYFRQAKAACEFAFTKEDGSIQYYQDIQSQQSQDSRLQIKSQLHAYMEEHFREPQMSIEQCADHLGYSVGYARQLFKDEMGVPFNEYLIHLRMEEAKRLLIETEKTAKEIAESIGIEDVRYFYTIFKNRTGRTAQQYRKEHAESGRNT
jgi:AraC-like DNA-binding protein